MSRNAPISGASTAGRSPGADDGRAHDERMVDNMTFEKDLQARKADALKLYQSAKVEYLQHRTAENWRNFCDRKADCMRLGVRI